MILLDGAHNPMPLRLLIAKSSRIVPKSKRPFFLLASGPKALEEMLIQWQELENSRLILTTFEDPRAYSQEEMTTAANHHQLEEVNWREFLQNWQAWR